MPEKRLFFALWPNERQREQLREPIKTASGTVEGQLVFRGNWHVTLRFLGAVPEAAIPSIRRAMDAIQPEPFRLRFDRLEFWPRPKIACLLASSVPPALSRLVQTLDTLAEAAGLGRQESTYRPHITIARHARSFPSEPLAQPVMLEWSGFELMESVATAQGVRYYPAIQ
ncbi:RNA 2',3'-cyclic phosphodiesterase [Woeseia oceani]|uniref:2'-5' RNA ligase n=1 Tax=Woeseia oceani TaxID=1548547 RepID=A0A193LI32_9GAMM|nr:RNA 2',3'-cyclic phosphodiesterase [Woeseia oceani]ANO52151.1 2'-5' RNA ligase [Woeseia oceani]